MGVKAALRHSNVPNEPSDSAVSDHEMAAGSKAGGPISSNRAFEKQSSQRRKVDSVLDDIMGDPDDFRDIADSDGESDGGRWEDAVRAALEHEEAKGGAVRLEIRDSEDIQRKGSGNAARKTANSGTDRSKFSPQRPSPTVDPGSSEQKGKGSQEKAQESEGRKHASNAIPVSSESKEEKNLMTKYFIIKSLNHHNIAKSVEKGIWATQAMNEPVLNEAYETSERVLLVFSVNMSGHFQGYAQMTSPIGRRRANVWSEANEGANPWGGTFSVDWLRLYELPFQKTVHLKNPLNFFKPVKISRDCQELTQEVGDALCELIDEGSERDGRPKRKVTVADLESFTSKRRRKEALGVPSNGGARLPAIYPLNISPGVLRDPSPLPRVSDGFLGQSPYSMDGSRGSKSKSPHPVSERGLARERDIDRSHRYRERNRPSERDRPRDRTRSNSSTHSADLQVDEDLLNMTYEEYLQRHGHGTNFNKGYHQSQGGGPHFNNLPNPAYGGGWSGRNPMMGFPDDRYSNYVTNWYSRQGPAVGGDSGFHSIGMGNNYHVGHPQDVHWIGHADHVRERRHVRPPDGRHGQGFLDNNGRSSGHGERMTGVGS